MEITLPTASQRNKATQNLEATQVMVMLMEHLFIQDLNLLLYIKKRTASGKIGQLFDNKRSRL